MKPNVWKLKELRRAPIRVLRLRGWPSLRGKNRPKNSDETNFWSTQPNIYSPRACSRSWAWRTTEFKWQKSPQNLKQNKFSKYSTNNPWVILWAGFFWDWFLKQIRLPKLDSISNNIESKSDLGHSPRKNSPIKSLFWRSISNWFTLKISPRGWILSNPSHLFLSLLRQMSNHFFSDFAEGEIPQFWYLQSKLAIESSIFWQPQLLQSSRPHPGLRRVLTPARELQPPTFDNLWTSPRTICRGLTPAQQLQQPSSESPP